MFSSEEILGEFCERAYMSRELHRGGHLSSSREGYEYSLLLKKRAQTAESVRRWKARPGNKEKVSARMKEYYRKPGVRERCLAYNHMRYQDPVYRAAQRERSRNWLRKKRAELKAAKCPT